MEEPDDARTRDEPFRLPGGLSLCERYECDHGRHDDHEGEPGDGCQDAAGESKTEHQDGNRFPVPGEDWPPRRYLLHSHALTVRIRPGRWEGPLGRIPGARGRVSVEASQGSSVKRCPPQPGRGLMIIATLEVGMASSWLS